MSGTSELTGKNENGIANSIADDSIKLFRAGLFMITIYAALISIILRDGGGDVAGYVRDSPYTRFGFVFWMGSMMVTVITYWASRRLSCAGDVGEFILFTNTQDLSDYTTAALLSFLTSIFLLLFGLIESYIKFGSDNPSKTGLELETIALFIVLSFSLVFVTGGIIFFVRIIRTILSNLNW